MLVENERTYELIEKMISSCRAAFNSRHIHIGMDEAHHIGRGRYYDQHGDRNSFELMLSHMNKVIEICRKYDFEPMFWSDMFFKIYNNGLYYGDNPVPSPLADSIPPQTAAVYWDYYHDDYDGYARMIREHKKLPCKTVFAGGAWKWGGYLPSLKRSLNRSRSALRACIDNGVDSVFLTLWGDDGADASLFSVWPVVQLYAEQNFHRTVNDTRLAERLKTCSGAELEDFFLLDAENEAGGAGEFPSNSPGKYLLFQDLLTGIFDAHVAENANLTYGQMQQSLKTAAKKGGRYGCVFDTAAALCGVLAIKADCGVQIKRAYDDSDRESLAAICEEKIPEIIHRVKDFRRCLESQWMKENKVFGFEVQDIRLGALIQRLKTARGRLRDYLDGNVPELDELKEDKLPFFEYPIYNDFNQWKRMVTVSYL